MEDFLETEICQIEGKDGYKLVNRQLNQSQALFSSLIGLLVLNAVMLLALFAQVAPNPPGKFGPFIGATISLAAMALPLISWQNRWGLLPALLAALMSLLSLGPHKLFLEPTAALLWPVILLGSVLILLVVVSGVSYWRTCSSIHPER